MNNNTNDIEMEIKFWLEYKYPTTIIKDRYNGSYSNSKWLAFPTDYYKVPKEVDGDDVECMVFWESYKGYVGKGNTAEEAFNNLKDILFQKINE